MREGLRPTNTAKAMDPKIEEYFQFCETVYASDPYKYNLSYEKVYRFMWYTCFREKKQRSATKAMRSSGISFDVDGYNELMNSFQGGHSAIDYPQPKNPISKATFAQYKSVFRKIYKVQVAKRVIGVNWDHIWQMGFDELAIQPGKRTDATNSQKDVSREGVGRVCAVFDS